MKKNLLRVSGSRIYLGRSVATPSNKFIYTTELAISGEASTSFKSWGIVEKPIKVECNCSKDLVLASLISLEFPKRTLLTGILL